MGYTKKDRKCARDTQNPGRTCLTNALSTSRMERGTVVATRIAKQAAVCSQDIKESRRPLLCPKSQEVSHVNILSTPPPIRLCPVTGLPIPSLAEIEKKIDKNLILSNWHWPRSIAIKGIALALSRWAEEVGLEKAAQRGEILLGDLLGGVVDEIERNVNGTHERDNAGWSIT